jgi:hypothetical protein
MYLLVVAHCRAICRVKIAGPGNQCTGISRDVSIEFPGLCQHVVKWKKVCFDIAGTLMIVVVAITIFENDKRVS